MTGTHDLLAHAACPSRVRPADKKSRRPASRTRGRQTIAEPKPETEQRQPGREDYTLADDKVRTENQGKSNNRLLPQKPRGDVSRWLAYLSLDPRNSDRPVAARWGIAVLIAGGTKLPRSYSDEWVQRAVRYLRLVNSSPKKVEALYQLWEMSDVDEAFRLCWSSDPLARGTVEARLLAGQTIKEVAAACDLSEETVAAYHALFFSVQDKLKAPFYIHNHAIGVLPCDVVPEEAVDVILKRAGYLRGPIFLEMFLRYYRIPLVLPNKLADLTREQLNALYEWLLTRTLIKAWVLPPAKILRLTTYQQLLDQMQQVIDTWPGPIEEGSQPDPVDTSLLPADREAWWSVWRQAVESADSEQDLGDIPADPQIP